jgi:small multidrug resistance pump
MGCAGARCAGVASGMVYLWLALAIVFEVGWAVSMKVSEGLTRPGPTVATIVMYLLSVVFLSLATKRMDVGLAYALWAGSGAALIGVVGMWWFREPVTALRVASIGLIVLGIVGLQAGSGGHGAGARAALNASGPAPEPGSAR